MDINYHDKNLIVMYLQVFLRDYFGLTVKKVKRRAKTEYNEDLGTYKIVENYGYEITRNDPIKVTGEFNLQTYSSVSLYMAYNFPNEGYPYQWKEDFDGVWRVKDYVDRSSFRKNSNEIGEVSRLDDDTLIKIISNNMENSRINPSSIKVPERILSYIFGEVVTPRSSKEEIVRVKKILVDTVNPEDAFKYRNPKYGLDLFEEVLKVQESYVKDHTVEGEDPDYPVRFKDFKVTGYVDPWTEVLLKGGLELDE